MNWERVLTDIGVYTGWQIIIAAAIAYVGKIYITTLFASHLGLRN